MTCCISVNIHSDRFVVSVIGASLMTFYVVMNIQTDLLRCCECDRGFHIDCIHPSRRPQSAGNVWPAVTSTQIDIEMDEILDAVCVYCI